METMSHIDNIKKTMALFLELEEFRFETQEENERRVLIQLGFSAEQGPINYYVDYQIESNLIQFTSFASHNVPENKRNDVQTYYSLVNDNNTHWGSIHLNALNGQTFSRSSLLLDDLEDVSIGLVKRAFHINMFNLNTYFPGTMKIVYGDVAPLQVYKEVLGIVDDE
jgi:hypothetical protein